MVSFILALLCSLVIVVADQLSKYYIASNFLLGESEEFINGIVNIVYVQNRGAAWGMMSGKTLILLCFTIVVMVICIAVMIKTWNKNRLLFWSLSLVFSGGSGNLIDRIFRKGTVIDFLQFAFWQKFPVFNIADCAIVIGGAILVICCIIDTVNEYKQKRKTEEQLHKVSNEDN